MTKQFFIIKNGYMFRPDCKGYTASEAEAGRYTESECDWYRDQEEISFRECTPTPAPQGAPETIWIAADLDIQEPWSSGEWNDGILKEHIFTDMAQYTRKDLSDARIAELQSKYDALLVFQASDIDTELLGTIVELKSQLTTARNEALEALSKGINDLEEADDVSYSPSYYQALSDVEAVIRALKSEGEG